MKHVLLLMFIVILSLSGCADRSASSVSASSTSDTDISASAGNNVAKPDDVLCLELEQRGIADYRNAEFEPYFDNINGCISSNGEFDVSELLVYKINTEPSPDNYMIAAISKDLKHFFTMSHADGIMYDIRDNPAYIHDGEYSVGMAQQELEQYLLAETTIDLGQYNIFAEAKHMDGADNYYIVLNEKDAIYWTDHTFEFYVSKDLKRIAQIDYVDGPAEELQYVGVITLTPGATSASSYTIDEVKQILIQWLQPEISSQANGDFIEQQEVKTEKVPLYQFRVPAEDGTTDIYRISADLSYADRLLAVETIERQPQFTYLKDEK